MSEEIAKLEARAKRAAAELRAEHRPEAIRLGAWGCVVCYPADGSWPCVSHMIADDLDPAESETT